MNHPMSREEFLSNYSFDTVDYFAVYLTTERGHRGIKEDINAAMKELRVPAADIISIVLDQSANCFLVFYRR